MLQKLMEYLETSFPYLGSAIAGAGALWLSLKKQGVDGTVALSTSEARFRVDILAELKACNQRHLECEERWEKTIQTVNDQGARIALMTMHIERLSGVPMDAAAMRQARGEH